MITDDMPIYYLDRESNQYMEVTKLYLEEEVNIYDSEGNLVTDDDGNPVTQINKIYIGNKVIDNYYIPELDAGLYCEYSGITALWEFSLNTVSDLTKTIYKQTSHQEEVEKVDEDGNPIYENEQPVMETVTVYDYEPLTVYYDKKTKEYHIREFEGQENEILDPNKQQQYYSVSKDRNGNDVYNLITNMRDYLQAGVLKYYVLDSETGKYFEVAVDDLDMENDKFITARTKYYKRDSNTGQYSEVEEESLDKSNDDYIIAYVNNETGMHVFERHYFETIYDEKVERISSVYIKDIDLYYYDDNRVYYELVYTYVDKVDDEGNIIPNEGTYEVTYREIEIPKWIVAEFVTEDEDIDALILNANAGLGEEDNTVIDTTIEDTDTYVETVSIERIVPGDRKPLYYREADGSYTVVNLNKDRIYGSSMYYIENDEPAFVEITGEEAIAAGIIELYTKNENDQYVIYRDSIIESNIYYKKEKVYDLVSDPDEYLREYTLNLVFGEPKLLPIKIYPLNATRAKMTIEYDSRYIKFFEDGRIAATIGDTIEDTRIIIRSDENPETVYCIIHVNLLTPISKVELDSTNVYEVKVGESVDIRYEIKPETSSIKNIIWEENDKVQIEQIDENTIRVTGLEAGKLNIRGTAEDGYGVSVNISFEVITPVTAFYWDQENIKYVEPEYYYDDEIEQHNIDFPDDPWEAPKVRVPGYHFINVLHNRNYNLYPVIEPDTVEYKGITWTEARETRGTASVSNDNVLTATKLGETTIYGQLTKFPEIDPISLRVFVNKSITAVNVTPSALSMNVNTKKKITATIEPADLTNVSLQWSSSDESILKINNNESDFVSNIIVIESLAIGNARIIATGVDGEEVSTITGSCEVTVTIPAKDITVEGETISDGIIYVGCDEDVNNNTTTISAVITRDDNFSGGDMYKLGVIWSVVDDTIAEVTPNDEKGLTATITGHEKGRTTIIASAADGSGVFGTIQVQVVKLTENIEFDLSDFATDDDGNILMEVGDSFVLSPKFTPESTNEIVIWQSSDETVAKVKESGIVYALSEGNATITVTSTDGSKKEATCGISIQ